MTPTCAGAPSARPEKQPLFPVTRNWLRTELAPGPPPPGRDKFTDCILAVTPRAQAPPTPAP